MSTIIQFLTDERLMIRGLGTTAVMGQLLECGPGKPGERFTVLSKEAQIAMFGHEMYAIIAETDDETGRLVKSSSVDDSQLVDPENARVEPTGEHEALSVAKTMRPKVRKTVVVDDDDDEDEEVEKPRKKKSSTKASTKKSSSKSVDKVKAKRSREK